MHIIPYKIRHFQIKIAVTTYYLLHDSAQGMSHHGLSGEVGLGQYTGEENAAHAQNAADSAPFAKGTYSMLHPKWV